MRWINCLPGSSAGWALPEKMIWIGRSGSLTILGQPIHVGHDQGGPFVRGKTPGEADGKDVRIEDISCGFDGFVAFAAAAALAANAAADEGQKQVFQGVVRFPKLARIDVVDHLPYFGLAHAFHPGCREIAVVQLLHSAGQPALNVNAVGDVPDGYFLFHAPWPEMGPHAPGDVPVQIAHGVCAAGKFQAQHGHAERFVVVLRFDATQAHQLVERYAQFVAQRVQGVLR